MDQGTSRVALSKQDSPYEVSSAAEHTLSCCARSMVHVCVSEVLILAGIPGRTKDLKIQILTGRAVPSRYLYLIRAIAARILSIMVAAEQ